MNDDFNDLKPIIMLSFFYYRFRTQRVKRDPITKPPLAASRLYLLNRDS